MSGVSTTTVIVTGANIGIGFKVSEVLCRDGYDVILACRSQERGESAIRQIKSTYPTAKATFMQLDLASLSSVRSFVKTFQDSRSRLDVLINNAGVWMGRERQTSPDGYEMTMHTNHLGPFLLTNLLLDDLKKTAKEYGEARIVNVASLLHSRDSSKKFAFKISPFDLDDLMLEKPGAYEMKVAYSHSKLCSVLFTYELSNRLEGTGVTANCLCPGFIPRTSLNRNSCDTWYKRIFLQYILYYMLRPFGLTKTVEEGCQAELQIAISDELKGITGKYYADMEESLSSEDSRNIDLQKRLWDMSIDLVDL